MLASDLILDVDWLTMYMYVHTNRASSLLNDKILPLPFLQKMDCAVLNVIKQQGYIQHKTLQVQKITPYRDRCTLQ